MRHCRVIPVTVLALAATVTAIAGEKPRTDALTNYDVMELVKAGLSEEVVLAKIAASEVEFDISTDAIITLKKSKVPESVIAAMIVRETGAPTRDRGAATSLRPDVQSTMAVELRAGGTVHRLEGTYPRDRYVNAVVALLWFKRLKGEEAAVQVADRDAVIAIPRSIGGVNVNLSGVHLVKLEVDHDEEAREYRLDWGTPFRFVMEMEPEDDYVVKYDSTEEGDFLVLKPRKPLSKGQYAVVDEHQYAYDFAVK